MEDGSKTKSSTDNVLVVTARLDGVTMFDQTEVGFDSPASGSQTMRRISCPGGLSPPQVRGGHPVHPDQAVAVTSHRRYCEGWRQWKQLNCD